MLTYNLQVGGSGSSGGSSSGSSVAINATHITPIHGQADYSSGEVISLNMPFTVDDLACIVTGVRVKKADGSFLSYVDGVDDIEISASVNEVTVEGAEDDPFADDDLIYNVYIIYKPVGDDLDYDSVKTLAQNSVPILSSKGQEVTDTVDLASGDTTVTDIGYAVDVRDKKTLAAWITFAQNSSSGCELRALLLHTDGGTEYGESDDSHIIDLDTIGDGTYKLPDFDVETARWVQFQGYFTTGGATEATIKLDVTGVPIT